MKKGKNFMKTVGSVFVGSACFVGVFYLLVLVTAWL